jgi:hypothetical protein
MPFTHYERGITGLLETFWQGVGLGGQRSAQILDAIPVLILATHQRRPGRGANRAIGIRVGETNPAMSDAVNVGSRDILASLHAKIAIAHVVCQNENDIGLLLTQTRGGGNPVVETPNERLNKPTEANVLFNLSVS